MPTSNPSNRTNARQRAQAAARRRTRIIAVAAIAAILIVAVVLIIALSGRDRGDPSVAAANVTAEPAAETTPPSPTPTPTPAPTYSPERRAETRPTPTAEGFAPVFRQADTDEKICAITVDDCNQAENLAQIVNKAIEVGGKLTIFPIGKNVIRESVAASLKKAWEHGFELENHTYTHNGLYAVSDERLAEEVYKQQLALSYILNVEYQPHFLRPAGGDARHDQRLQKYAEQLGYYGIAYWSASGSGASSMAEMRKGLKPGAIFLFHTTDRDLEKLMAFIPWVVEQGYQLVTLNEMFGYPENETSELTTPIGKHEIPPLEKYKRVYTTMKKRTHSWYVYLLQTKLKEMGYLRSKPDGIFGAGTEKAVIRYQKAKGLEQTGVADPALIKAVLGG